METWRVDYKLYVLGFKKHENIILKMWNEEEIHKILKEVIFIRVGVGQDVTAEVWMMKFFWIFDTHS